MSDEPEFLTCKEAERLAEAYRKTPEGQAWIAKLIAQKIADDEEREREYDAAVTEVMVIVGEVSEVTLLPMSLGNLPD